MKKEEFIKRVLAVYDDEGQAEEIWDDLMEYLSDFDAVGLRIFLNKEMDKSNG